jgi:arylsulfatase
MKTARSKFNSRGIKIAAMISILGISSALPAQNARGSATGPTSAKGFDHPGQYLHMQDVKPADNMYPVI